MEEEEEEEAAAFKLTCCWSKGNIIISYKFQEYHAFNAHSLLNKDH